MTDVTIVIATYNRPALLEVELHSILASAATVKPRGIVTRIIVVDDASETDAAKHIAKRLGVDYVRHATNSGGVAQPLVTGFEMVDSPYYAFWGDDDYMLPRWFAKHLERIAEGHDVVSSPYWKTDPDLRPTQQVNLVPVTMADLLNGDVSANDGSLVRRSAVEGIPWRPERVGAMMMTMWLALAAAGRKFSLLDEPTWLYRRHPGQLSVRLKSQDMAIRRAAIAEYLPT